jgi:parvulin-like peptidyl-prolyl isomerase
LDFQPTRKQYRARHILLSDTEDAEYVLELLARGDTFEQIAKELSECETASKGGDLGLFGTGIMVPEFERALSKLEVDEISKPVKTKFGFHIIQRLKLS